MIEIKRYTPSNKKDWDEFITKSKNGTFLFHRDYMEYHSDRFVDFSLMIYKKKKLTAVLPANIVGDTVYSHQGLTFGGIVSSKKNTSIEYIHIYNSINEFLISQKITKLILKTIPQIYKSQYGDEEVYTMFRANANLISCNLSSCINLKTKNSISRNRMRNYKKAIDNGLVICKSQDYATFWKVMEHNLQHKFNVKPVHNVDEMIRLSISFPNHIELWKSEQNGTLVGGAVVYKFDHVIKVQYAHASNLGKLIGAIDSLYFNLIETYKDHYDCIDFGTSNTENGFAINEGLFNQKESFGARGVTLSTYEIETSYKILIK